LPLTMAVPVGVGCERLQAFSATAVVPKKQTKNALSTRRITPP
jgi:hypothetical protein